VNWCGTVGEETREAEDGEQVSQGGWPTSSRSEREELRSLIDGGVRMIDNERYKVDDLLLNRPIRKKVCCDFFDVSD